MNQEWLDWTKLNLERGCDPNEIRDILRNNGFSDADIEVAMQPNKHSFWQKLTGKTGVEKEEIDSDSGIQAGLDYAKLAEPNLLLNPNLQTIEAEGIQLYMLDDFMTPAECEAVVEVMESNLRPSTITTGNDYSGFRTSSTCDLGHQSAKVVEKIDKRIARTLGIRVEWSEVIQGQKYEVGQEFKAHTDYFTPGTKEFKKFASDLGQRTWTFMVYLNETPKGGATHFTKIDQTFYPKVGRAVIWNNLNKDGSPNPKTMHHGMPVEEGCKEIITKWFRDKGKGNPLYSKVSG